MIKCKEFVEKNTLVVRCAQECKRNFGEFFPAKICQIEKHESREVMRMKDIPVFTTENGAASLLLGQIPHTKTAYIQLQASLAPEKLLEDCVAFCIACDAQRICACGDPCLQRYPVDCRVLRMQRIHVPREPEYALFPLMESTKERWRDIYNTAMADVDNASLLSYYDMDGMLRDGDCYFVHEKGSIVGIGKASCGEVKAIVSLKKGCGMGILNTLSTLLHGERESVIVASTNLRAIRMYERAGFLITGEEKIWYRIR